MLPLITEHLPIAIRQPIVKRQPKAKDSETVWAGRFAGFTLIEVMLAMVITAFVAMLAYSGLDAAMSAAESHEGQAERIAEIQLPLSVLERDIRNSVARPIRDEYDQFIGAMVGGELNDYPLILTRSGWDNPRELPRSNLQRVRYVLDNEELWRESWPVLERLSEEEGQTRTLLLAGIKRFQLSFLNPGSVNASQSPLGGEWIEEWSEPQQLPLAVEITLEIDNFGEVKRVFSLPAP